MQLPRDRRGTGSNILIASHHGYDTRFLYRDASLKDRVLDGSYDSFHRLLVHLIPSSASRYPAFVQFFLQPRNLLQALRIPYQGLYALLLLLRKLHPIAFVARNDAVGDSRDGRDVKSARLDAHYLRKMSAYPRVTISWRVNL